MISVLNVFGGCVAGLTLLYALLNDSGHTGIPILLVSIPFMLLMAVAFAVYRKAQGGSDRLSASRGIIIGIFGAVLPPVLHFGGILMQYEAWIGSGMPEPPAWRIPFLIGYAAALSAAVIAAGVISGREEDRSDD